MEFLTALKEARELGLSKEEFLDIWRREAIVKDLQSSRAQQKTSLPNNTSIMAEGGYFMGPQFNNMDQLQYGRENELQVQFQHMFNQVQEAQASLERKQTEMREEFRRHFEVLTKHISNCVDSQTTSLKHFMTQELDLVQRELAGKMDRLTSCGEAEACDTVRQQGQQHQQQQQPRWEFVEEPQQQQQQQELKQEQEYAQWEFQQQEQQLQHQPQHQELSQLEWEHQEHIQGINTQHQEPQEQSLDCAFLESFQILQQEQDHQQQNHLLQQQQRQREPSLWGTQQITQSSIPTANAISDRRSPHLQAPTQETRQAAVEVQNVDNEQTATQAQLLNPLTNQSIPATGPYAAAIARLTQEDVPRLAGQLSSSVSLEDISTQGLSGTKKKKRKRRASFKLLDTGFSLSRSVVSLDQVGLEENVNSAVKLMSEQGSEFIISDSNEFVESTRVYTTAFFQRSSKICKMRVQVSFDSDRKLQIRLLVFRGEKANTVAWPLFITSFGYIYHTGSKEYTNIWRMEQQECRLPRSQEEAVTLVPQVCLWTLRGTHSNVTYGVLELRKYTGNDSLQFKWSFHLN